MLLHINAQVAVRARLPPCLASPGTQSDACWSYHLAVGDAIDDGAEVFSLMRDSTLGHEEYLSRFFATGTEHETIGQGDPSANP